MTHLITFSPTGTSRKVGNSVICGLGTRATVTDLTRSVPSLLHVPHSSVAVFVVPVYGGHVAPTALERMKGITSDGAAGVAVVVYGNRHYEKALEELGTFMRHAGFKVVAGGTFVGEHSYSTTANPIAVGRPDDADLAMAEQFGRMIYEKVALHNDLKEVCLDKIPCAPMPPESLSRFIAGVRDIHEMLPTPSRIPVADSSLCTSCGRCVAACPTQAIQYGSPCVTASDKCIRCCACVKCCPAGARSFDTPFAPLLSRNFQERREPCFIL